MTTEHQQPKPIARERIKLKPCGVRQHKVFVDGVAVAVVWGGRDRDHSGVHANFGIDTLDGKRLCEGYSYFADVVKMLPWHLPDMGIK